MTLKKLDDKTKIKTDEDALKVEPAGEVLNDDEGESLDRGKEAGIDLEDLNS